MSLSRAKDLRAERRNLAERMQAILAEPAGEGGQLNSEQEAEFDRLHAKQEELKSEYTALEEREARQREREEQVAAIKAEMEDTRGVKAGDQDTRQIDEGTRDEPVADEKREYDRAFRAWMMYGTRGLNQRAQDILARGHSTVDMASANVPAEMRDLAVNQDTKGGFLVPEGFYNQIVEGMKSFGGMRQSRATVIPTSSGNDLPIPTDDDTSNVGHILSENATETTQDVTFGQVVLHAYMYSSKIVKVSRQLLQDSAFDMPSFLARKLSERIGRITNTHFTTGDAAAKPQGIITGATSGVTAAAVDAWTVDELYELKHAVDPSYRNSAQWMLNDAGLLFMKKLKDGDGRPLWQSGVATREADMIDGDPYIINQDMPALTTGLKPVAYGDFSLYYIRDVLGITLLRLDERYADALQVGFLAFSRHDGVLVDAGQHPVKVLTLA